jgi:Cu+-exporting ATPase
MILKSATKGLTATILLFGIYFGLITLISGWSFALDQFSRFWYFIIALALGFGVQVGFYFYLKDAVHRNASRGLVAVSGTTSTVAMVSCCAHYLANILPIIGIAGFLSVISQYQVQLFWLGLVFNFAGIAYIGGKIMRFYRS